MSKQFEFWIGGNCCVEGSVVIVDDSYSHAFGTKYGRALEIKDFRILFYIDGTEFDITQSIKEKNPFEYSGWREKLMRIAYENLNI